MERGRERRQKLPVSVFPPLRNGVHKCEEGEKKKRNTQEKGGGSRELDSTTKEVEMRERGASSNKAAKRTCKYMREPK